MKTFIFRYETTKYPTIYIEAYDNGDAWDRLRCRLRDYFAEGIIEDPCITKNNWFVGWEII